MGEVDERAVGNAVQQARVRADLLERIPADVGDFRTRREMFAGAPRRARALQSSALPCCPRRATGGRRRYRETACLWQPPCERAVRPRSKRSGSTESGRRRAGRSCPREHNFGAGSRESPVRRGFRAVERLDDAGEVPRLVVNDCDHSSPFVLGSISSSACRGSRRRAGRARRP